MSSGYICQFNDLEVRAVLLDEIMKVSKLKNYNSDPITSVSGSIEGKGLSASRH